MSRVEQAAALMTRFAERTGDARRYLWTDAFAVCSFLGLGEVEPAMRMIERVHRVLGRHRADDPRTGWISGLSSGEGEAHPTAGGLRIGKPLPERGAGQPLDEALEWERDGQYFHYLTKWMHALDQAAVATGRAGFSTWACELADVAYRSFAHGDLLYWKLSIDLSRPLVPSMGQHDPLDGFVTCRRLIATRAALSAEGPDLEPAAARFASMIAPPRLVSTDPLGIGGLLFDALRLSQLGLDGDPLLEAVLAAALVGLRGYLRQGDLGASASNRLGFRELGLAIGLAAVPGIRSGRPQVRAILDELGGHAVVRDQIERFWLTPAHRQTRTWLAHADINEVMLATCLVPEGFLMPGRIDA